jgi:hypothetical protein
MPVRKKYGGKGLHRLRAPLSRMKKTHWAIRVQIEKPPGYDHASRRFEREAKSRPINPTLLEHVDPGFRRSNLQTEATP